MANKDLKEKKSVQPHLISANINPLVYTKLICFLPWAAGQFRLEFRTGPEEPTCSESHGQTNFHEAKFTAHIGCDEKPAHSASKIAALKVNRSRQALLFYN